MFLKVDNVGAERMSSGRLFQATGPATQTKTNRLQNDLNCVSWGRRLIQSPTCRDTHHSLNILAPVVWLGKQGVLVFTVKTWSTVW